MHHTFLYIISFLFLHDYDMKLPTFTFYGRRKQGMTKFYQIHFLSNVLVTITLLDLKVPTIHKPLSLLILSQA